MNATATTPPTANSSGFDNFNVTPSKLTLYYQDDSAYNVQGCKNYESLVF